MRKYLILTILLSCLHITARGQTITEEDFAGLFNSIQAKSLRYWFDGNSASQQTNDVLSGNHTLDVNHLADGLHTLHYQAVGTDGLGYDVASHVFLKVANNMIDPAIAAEEPAARLQYWFDGNTANLQVCNGLSGVYTLDVNSLSDGLHTLHYQVVGTNGTGYGIASHVFLKAENNSVEPTIDGVVNIAKLEYWFDSNTASKQSTNDLSGIYTLDVSQLLDGIHTLHYQVVGTDGVRYDTSSDVFLKMEGLISDDALLTEQVFAEKLEYWFDGNSSAKQAIENLSGIQILDVSQLTYGLHTLHYQVVGTNGGYYDIASEVFLKLEESVAGSDIAYTPVAKELKYWFDRDAASAVNVDAEEGIKVIDVSTLQSGLHTVNYQIVYDDGSTSPSVTGLFLKDFDEEQTTTPNAITKYQYWLNGNSAAMKTIELPPPVPTYTLISLLPLQKEPLRSTFFVFEVTNGTPTIYAKNELHVRFHDARGYFIDGDKSFVDYSVKQEVTDVEWLESGVRATTAKPTVNAIKWYCLEAEAGDSLQFKLDRAATIQLFAPSGEEAFNASGSNVVKWGGCHVIENGTYYLALHDVTAKNGNTINIDYNHIDKYAVLRQDVRVVGNGGCSTITFEGNGFRDLYAVELTDGNGNTIEHIYIGHESDATTSVVFDFTDAVLGVYNAVFHFTEEDKVFNNLVTVEEARDIELATTVTYPSTFLRGRSTTYTIKITNNGNMAAYCVPLELRLRTESKEDITEVWFNEFMGSVAMPKELIVDSLDEDVRIILKEEFENMSDISQFVFYYDSINNVDCGLSQLFLNIRPNTTELLTVTISSSTDVTLESTITKEWIPITCSDNASSRALRIGRKSPGEWMCCYRQQIECAADIVASLASLGMPPGANCATSLSVTGLEAVYDILCSEGNTASEKFKNYLEKEKESLKGKLLSSGISCITGYFDRLIKVKNIDKKQALSLGNTSEALRITEEIAALKKNFGNLLKMLTGSLMANDIFNCATILSQPKPNCPPNPDNGGGTSNIRNSNEPNAMLGYVAESGSKAIKEGLTDVFYTIQFENDTVFATAPAHDIYLTDTLDVNLFDLSTYRPTKITIGNKSMVLTGERNFISTMDMRPEINAIAQIEGTINDQTGIVRWHISSLDPMTMEPIEDAMIGVLPVNFDGSGLGEASYDISLKKNLPHGTVIPNRSGNVFDSNETVLTPTFENVIDRIAPESHVTDVKMLNDSTATVSIEAEDELSGPWRYNVYVQYGDGAWFLEAENVPIDKTASVKVYEGINHGFYVVVTDSAGNIEQKNAEREFTLEVFGSQVDTNTQLALAEGWNWVSHNQNETLAVDGLKPKAQRILSQTEELYKDARFGWSGDLEELSPTQMYKLQMAEAANIQLSGKLFNVGFRSVPLYAGWNWLGYPVANSMTVAEALEKFEAEEGDFIIGQDGMATYSDGQWTGTLTELQPGKGYMYRTGSDKNLFYNATAQASSRRAGDHRSIDGRQPTIPEDWTVDKRKYPNVMGLVANLVQNGFTVDADEWLVAAFCGDECRGVAQTVDGVLMMNIYGTGSEPINFYAMKRDTEELLMAEESDKFRVDVLGSMQQPYQLHISEATGIKDVNNQLLQEESSVYDLQGRQISGKLSSINSQLKKGIYIVTDSKRTKTQKVVR